MAQAYEETLCVVEPAFVYKLPPVSTVSGYKAGDWELDNPIWTGRLRVQSQGEKAWIRLEDRQTCDAFAVCHVHVEKDATGDTVEPVSDSSRYYVLRIDDLQSGRHAFIGMGFHDREQSFEFKASLQDHKRRILQERELRMNPPKARPKLDLQMKAGETLSIGGFGGSSFSAQDDEDLDDMSLSLMPPPSGNTKISKLSKHHNRAQQTKAKQQGSLLQMGSPAASPSPSAAAAAPGAQSPQGADPFGLLSMTTQSPGKQPVQGLNMSPMSSPSLGTMHSHTAPAPLHQQMLKQHHIQGAPMMQQQQPQQQQMGGPQAADPFAGLSGFGGQPQQQQQQQQQFGNSGGSWGF